MGRHSGPWDRQKRDSHPTTPTKSPSKTSRVFESAKSGPIIQHQDVKHQDAPIAESSAVMQESSIDNQEAKLLDAIDHTFKRVFGKKEYKGKQREIMLASVKGQDILVVAPTGMGKSLCFQVPALVEPRGVTLVICPLLSLMVDQVNALQKIGVKAEMWNSTTTVDNADKIRRDLKSPVPSIRLLYVTPERLMQPGFSRFASELFAEGELNRLVIDEAHCVIEWGHQFRKDYLRIGEFREMLLDSAPEGASIIPITAVTASAGTEMQDSVISSLSMRTTHLTRFSHSFNRPNLYYEISFLSTVDEKISAFVTYFEKLRSNLQRSSQPGKSKRVQGIIYCRLKKRCDYVTEQLRRKGIQGRAYHRDLKPRDLECTQNEWVNGSGEVDVVVATVAFGMGIDKKDCRFVVHFDIPTSFEGYYQETGRAGRDGHVARCLLYYSKEDAWEVMQLRGREAWSSEGFKSNRSNAFQNAQSVLKLIQYIENVTTCRHLTICSYFGEEVPEMGTEEAEEYCKKMCDVCKKSKKERLQMKETVESLEAPPPATQKLLTEQLEKEGVREEVRGEEEWAFSQQDRNVPREYATVEVESESQSGSEEEMQNSQNESTTNGPLEKETKKRKLTVEEGEEEYDITKGSSTTVSKKSKPVDLDTDHLSRNSFSSGTTAQSEESEEEETSIILQPDTNQSRPFLRRSVRLRTVQELTVQICKTMERTDSWQIINDSKLTKQQRKLLAKFTAIRIESDMYWFSLTESKYQQRLEEQMEEMKRWKGVQAKIPIKWFIARLKERNR